MIELSREFDGYGYRPIAAPLKDTGWPVGAYHAERLWKREGLKNHKNNRRRGGCGSMTDHAPASDQSSVTTCGFMTSSTAKPMT